MNTLPIGNDMSNLNWSSRQPDIADSRKSTEYSLEESSEEKSRSTRSAFGNLPRLDDNDQSLILRTRSLDDGRTSTYGERCTTEKQGELDSSPAEALHSSFDTALLEDDRNYSSIFRFSSKQAPQAPYSPAWSHDDDPALGDLSGRKHLLQQVAAETTELNPPGTVRKLARRNSEESAGGKTPVRPPISSLGLPLKESNDPLSSSAIKRRRAPLHQRKSPLRRVLPNTHRETTSLRSTSVNTPKIPVPPETPFVKATTASKLGIDTISSSLGNMHQAMTPTRNVQGSLFCASTIKSSKVNFTGTTDASTIFETKNDAKKNGPSSPVSETFRFTSFPASLPRVNNLRTASRPCPDSVRKRMSFGDPNQSRDDDGTNNTSISSLSADGAQHVARTGSSEMKSDEPGDTSGRRTYADPIHTKLFLDDSDCVYSSDGDSTSSPLGGPFGRTRLNFNVLLSPQGENEPVKEEFSKESGMVNMPLDGSNPDLLQPYEQRRINSFPSPVSSRTPLRSISGCDDIATTSTAGLTPSRSGGCSGPLETQIENDRPETPKEVELHFQLNAAQCSPILGVREEEVGRNNVFPQSEECGQQDSSFPNDSNLKSWKSLEASKSADESRLSISQDSAESSSASSAFRRLRPMPDMSAFDSDAMSSSRNERSSDDSADGESKAYLSSPKLLCPPTPVRTPAWAHNESGGPIFPRPNSLTTTRVLATCSPLLLDQRCSLDEFRIDNVNQAPAHTSGNEIALSDVSRRKRDNLMPAIRQEFFRSGEQQFGHFSRSNIKPPQMLPRYVSGEVGSVISFTADFQTLNLLGSGAFADVYKVRSKLDNKLYAVKRNRRQFRGKKDRDMALAEVRSMQRLQSVCSSEERNGEKSKNIQYLLFFFRAWQEDGHFFCQTELCCRDTCRELMDSLRSKWNWAKVRYPSLLHNTCAPSGVVPGSSLDNSGRLFPELTIWKICHDISAGLSQIHSHGLVHHDIKPSNIFFVSQGQLGALCKIGDFGMAADIGASEDGQEGDQKYMAPELLTSGIKNPSSDIFSLGLTLYELASELSFDLPSEGPRWHELRNGSHVQDLPSCRTSGLFDLIQSMINPNQQLRPNAETISKTPKVNDAGNRCDGFLRDYILDIDAFDRVEEKKVEMDDKTPRNAQCRVRVCSPILGQLPNVPNLFTPEAHAT